MRAKFLHLPHHGQGEHHASVQGDRDHHRRHVGYNYTSIETRKVTVNGEETVIVPPVTPPVDPDTPDRPVEVRPRTKS